MSKPLPHRPNLDHLRSQAKALLGKVQNKDPDSIRFLAEHLPAASGMSAVQITDAGFRLADAQFAIARSTGFGSWPKLKQHVDLLRSLEGTWAFDSLEVDGQQIPSAHTQHSRILIDGDRFRTESPEATYEGVFNIDAESSPMQIDIDFQRGPEAGNWNFGIFKLKGERLEICLDMHGNTRPTRFHTQPGTGHAYEVLTRESGPKPSTPIERPEAQPAPQGDNESALSCAAENAAYVYRTVPFLHVHDVDASLAFYAKFGFATVKTMTDGRGKAFWALTRCGNAEVMLAQASGPIDADQQAVLLYMFSRDVAGLRARLIEGGLRDAGAYSGKQTRDDTTRSVYEAAHPMHMKQGELRIIDPDGYVILVGQIAQ